MTVFLNAILNESADLSIKSALVGIILDHVEGKMIAYTALQILYLRCAYVLILMMVGY